MSAGQHFIFGRFLPFTVGTAKNQADRRPASKSSVSTQKAAPA
jgi:hypothetical protein